MVCVSRVQAYLLESHRYMNIIGILCTLGLCYLFSNNKSAVRFKTVLYGFGLQFAMAFFILKTAVGHTMFAGMSAAVRAVYGFAEQGSYFVFGSLANPAGPAGMIFAVRVLPIIVFFGAFMSLLFHLRIIQYVVAGIAWLIRPVLGTSGAETLCAAANSFLGQTEAPLLIRHYLKDVTRSEMFVVMVSGFATVSGGLLAVYTGMGVPGIHLLAASAMAIPGSLLISKILYPETEKSKTLKADQTIVQPETKNILDAISVGTTDGMYLALNVGAMLISFLGLIALLNALLGYSSDIMNYLFGVMHLSWIMPQLSLSLILSYVFAPCGYLLGLTGAEALHAGELLGLKLSLNEFIAFQKMLSCDMSYRAQCLMAYALCGFANFSCIGIQIGGIGALIPSKRVWLSQLGLQTMFGGAAVTFLSALIAGLFI